MIPEIAPIVEHLTVFQRTPIWCFPKADLPLSPAARLAMRLPGGKAVQRLLSQAYVELTFPLANSYYFDRNGDVPLRPATTMEAHWRSRRFPLDDYEFSA